MLDLDRSLNEVVLNRQCLKSAQFGIDKTGCVPFFNTQTLTLCCLSRGQIGYLV